MDVLVLGLDGGERQIIEGMEMPFLSNQLKESQNINISEDLWNRGWASILNGSHGRNTGAFYAKPKLDGGHGTTQSFDTPGHENAPLKPLWRIAEDAGYTVGFMNPPTTVPAPEVDGFFVSGAGGGYSPADEIPEAAVYPDEVLDLLTDSPYQWETRFNVSGIRDGDEFISELKKTITARVNAYLKLCDKYDPGFSFFVQKEGVVLQNLLMSEIETMLAEDGPVTDLHCQIQDFFRELDEGLERVVNKLDPNHLLVISDHGQAAYRERVNLNPLLRDLGFQAESSKLISGPKSAAISAAKRTLPQSIKSAITDAAPAVIDEITTPDAEWSTTEAFALRYIPGVYINDQKRFGGPVRSTEVTEFAERIVTAFNDARAAEKHDLHARIYRDKHSESLREELLPDVWIDHDDTQFFSVTGDDLVEKNKAYHSAIDFGSVKRDMHTGIKGRAPLLCVSDGLVPYYENATDTTAIYHILKRYLAESEN